MSIERASVRFKPIPAPQPLSPLYDTALLSLLETFTFSQLHLAKEEKLIIQIQELFRLNSQR